MATIVASSTGGNWSSTAAWTGGVVPTAADDAQLTSTSGAITVTSGAACRSLDCTGYTNTLTIPAAITLSIGTATPGTSNIALKLVSGMTLTLGSTSTSAISFVSTSSTTQTIASGGRTLPTYTINGVGSSYQLADSNTTTTAATVTLTNGSFNTNGQTCSWGLFNSSNTNTRTLTLGASAISVTAQGTAWELSTTTNLTFNPGTSVVTYRGGNSNFQGGGLTYYGVVIGGIAGSMVLNGSNTYTNLTFQGANSGRVTVGNNQTVTGTLTASSDTAGQLTFVLSTVRGTARTITAAATNISNINFQDITAAGAAAPWATTNTGNMGGNTNITFPAGVTRYWVATTGGSWVATSSWSATSGGTSGASVPLPQDTAIFNANSITSTGRTITINAECTPSIDLSGVLNSPTVATTITNGIIFVNGSITYPSTVTPSSTTTYTMHGRGSHTISSGGVTFTNPITFESVGGTYTLLDNLTVNNTITHNFGTLTATTQNITCVNFNSNVTNVRALNMGSGTWTVTGTGNVWNMSTVTGLTLNANTSTIAITDSSTNAKNFLLATGPNFYNINIAAGGTGAVVFNIGVGHTFNNIMINGPKTVTFQATRTLFINDFIVNASSGNIVTVASTTSGSAFTLSKTSGIVSVDYVSLKDVSAVGGAGWYAGTNSTNVSNTPGWRFTTPAIAQAAGTGFNFFV